MSKRVVSLLLTLLLALSVCIPAFATAVEPADQTDVSESAETEETAPAEEEPSEEEQAEEGPAEEAPAEEETSEEESAEKASTGQPETTETEEETETSSDTTPEDPATAEEEQEDSDEIATIANDAKMITLKLIGAVDKLEIEDASGQKVTDGLHVPEGTMLFVRSGLDTGYIVEENMEISNSSGGAGGVRYRYSQDNEPIVESVDYYLRPYDGNNDGVVTFNIVKGVLVVLNDPYGGVYHSNEVIPRVLHVGEGFEFQVKAGFSVTVAGGSSYGASDSDDFYFYNDVTGEPLYRDCIVRAGAEETLVINVEKTDDPIPPYQPEETKRVEISYENESAFIGNHPDHFDAPFFQYDPLYMFQVCVDKDYTVKAVGGKASFDIYIYDENDFESYTSDLNRAVGKLYTIWYDTSSVTQINLKAVKGTHDLKLIVKGDKSALVSGNGLNQDGDILKEGRGKIRLKNGYQLKDIISDEYFGFNEYSHFLPYISGGSLTYDVIGGEIFTQYDIHPPTDVETLTVEVIKTGPARWIEVSINNPDDVSYSFNYGGYLHQSDYLINGAGNYVFLYDDGFSTNNIHSPLHPPLNLKRGYRPKVVGGTEEFAKWSEDDEWMDVFYITPDEGVDKIAITLERIFNYDGVFPDGANSSANQENLYGTVMHLLEMTDPEDPELAKLKELLENAAGKDVTAEVVMKEVPGPGGNFNVDDFNGEFYYVDIHIDIKIDGKVVGTIGTTDEALRFKQEYKEELGKIVVVVREHNGESEYLPVEIDGDTLWFSSDMFSIFAIGYTNDINYAEVDDIPNQEYTGKPVEPEVVVTANGKPLTLGQDYTVTYENNIEEGVATAIITGKNGFEGKKEVQFVIGTGELPSEPSKPSTKPTPTPTPKPDYGIIPDVPWYQYQPEDEGEYVPGPDEVTYSFPDVDPNAWYAGPVDWAAQSGVTAGYPDGNFHPDDTCTRAQIVTFLWKAAGTPMSVGTTSFSDVEQESFYYDAAVWAANSGIIAGYPDGNFHPDDPCTRAQIVAMLYRYANSPAVSGESKFFDVDAEAYYYNAAIWAEQNGIVAGYPDGGFHPNDACTRAQIVTMLYNYIKG